MKNESPSVPNVPSPESASVLKERALEAYKKLIDRGVKNPDNLDLNDSEVKVANELFYSWQKQVDAEVGEDRAVQHEANFSKTLFYYEAGFTDPQYLADVVGWLQQDLQNVDEESEAPLPELAEKIKTKISEIESVIG